MKKLVMLVISCMVLVAGVANADRLADSEYPQSAAGTIQRLHDDLKAAYEAADIEAVEYTVAQLDMALSKLESSDANAMARSDVRAHVDEAQQLNDELAAEIAAAPEEQRQALLLPGVVPALGVLVGSLLATLLDLVTSLLVVVPIATTTSVS